MKSNTMLECYKKMISVHDGPKNVCFSKDGIPYSYDWTCMSWSIIESAVCSKAATSELYLQDV